MLVNVQAKWRARWCYRGPDSNRVDSLTAKALSAVRIATQDYLNVQSSQHGCRVLYGVISIHADELPLSLRSERVFAYA